MPHLASGTPAGSPTEDEEREEGSADDDEKYSGMVGVHSIDDRMPAYRPEQGLVGR